MKIETNSGIWKISITLTDSQKEQLAEDSNEVRSLLKRYESEIEGKKAKVEATEAELEKQIAKAEDSVSLDDTKAIQNLETMRARRGLARKRIDDLEQRLSPLTEQIHYALQRAQNGNVLAKVLEPEAEQLRSAIVAHLAPLHTDLHALVKYAAPQTPLFQSFFHFYLQRRFDHGTQDRAVTMARQFLQIADSLIEGKMIWSFTPVADAQTTQAAA